MDNSDHPPDNSFKEQPPLDISENLLETIESTQDRIDMITPPENHEEESTTIINSQTPSLINKQTD